MKSLIIAFAMYSKLPMPKVEWTKDNMKYAMCYFPWIGIIIGLFYMGVMYLWKLLPCHETLRNIVLCIIPVLVTGGIHVDGFIDTIDARHSYQSRERKLEILKDPHVGAFAIIWIVVYFLAVFGFTSELSLSSAWIVAIGFVYSRSLSGLGVVTIQAARKDGLLVSFSSTAQTKKVQAVMYVYCVICMAAMMIVNPVIGSVSALTGVLVYYSYKKMAMKEFGGITGDLAGYFLQRCELAILMVSVMGDICMCMAKLR